MPDYLFRRCEGRHYSQALYEISLDLFALVQHWSPPASGIDRGRLFEGLLYRYAKARQLPLSEQAGSRTVRGARSASGFMHENDAVLAFPEFTVHCELKHLSGELSKNELLVFNQKGLDYLLAEGRTLRRLPFYRVILSGGLVSPAARRFAAQWGILVIEPDRLPFLLLHDLSGSILPSLRNVQPEDQDEIWDEVPRLVTPLQERLSRIGRLILNGEECVLGEYRLNWAIDHAQRVIGDYYWDALDEHDPQWLEDRFESVAQTCRLDDYRRCDDCIP
jgi:hypothetical protein